MQVETGGCNSECPFRSCLDRTTVGQPPGPCVGQCSSDSAWSWACSGPHCKPSHLRLPPTPPCCLYTTLAPQDHAGGVFGLGTTAGTIKMGWFCLDLRMRHPLSVFYTGVATPANAGTWALGGKSCLFLPCANFPDLAVESMWELLLGLAQGHSGARAYQNW
jgi:hypothetical protein